MHEIPSLAWGSKNPRMDDPSQPQSQREPPRRVGPAHDWFTRLENGCHTLFFSPGASARRVKVCWLPFSSSHSLSFSSPVIGQHDISLPVFRSRLASSL